MHLLLLHLLVVGSGDACVLPAVARAAHGFAAAAAASTATTDEASGMTRMTGMTRMAAPDRAGAIDGKECEHPEGAPAGHKVPPLPACQSMAPCAPAALAVAPATIARPSMLIDADPVGLVVLAPDSRTSAPEPPPPRA